MKRIALSLCFLVAASHGYAQSDNLQTAKARVAKLTTALKEVDADFKAQKFKVKDYQTQRDLLDTSLSRADVKNGISINKNASQVTRDAREAANKDLMNQNVVEKLFQEWKVDRTKVRETYRYEKIKNPEGEHVLAPGGHGDRYFARNMLYSLLPHMEKELQETGEHRDRLNQQLLDAQAVRYTAEKNDAAAAKLVSLIKESDHSLAHFAKKLHPNAPSKGLREEISKLDAQQKNDKPITKKMKEILEEIKALTQDFAEAKSSEARLAISQERGSLLAEFAWLTSQRTTLGFDPLTLREYDKKRQLLLDRVKQAEKREIAKNRETQKQERAKLQRRLPHVKKAMQALKILGHLPENSNIDQYAESWFEYMVGVVTDHVTPAPGGGTALSVLQIIAEMIQFRKTELIPAKTTGYQRMLFSTDGKDLEKWLIKKGFADNQAEAYNVRREMEELTGFRKVNKAE